MRNKAAVMVETPKGVKEFYVQNFNSAVKVANNIILKGVSPKQISVIDENNYIYRNEDGTGWGNQVKVSTIILDKSLAY